MGAGPAVGDGPEEAGKEEFEGGEGEESEPFLAGGFPSPAVSKCAPIRAAVSNKAPASTSINRDAVTNTWRRKGAVFSVAFLRGLMVAS